MKFPELVSQGTMPPSLVWRKRLIFASGTPTLPVMSMFWTMTLRFSTTWNSRSTRSSPAGVSTGSTVAR